MFYEDMLLFEDELADNGTSVFGLSIKQNLCHFSARLDA
jgi:hypothetical protein